MPRARDPARDKALEMWLDSGKALKLCEIAEQLRVPEATVRAWKCKDKWDKKNEKSAPKAKRSASNDDRNAPKRKRGAQPGHPPQGGAPLGNINAVTHGAYMRIYGDMLGDAEKILLPDLVAQDERECLKNQYAMLQLTERRLMGHINDIENGADMILHRTYTTLKPSGKFSAVGKEITKAVKVSHEQETRMEMLQKFIAVLTSTRAEMRRVADSLSRLDERKERLDIERAKLEESKGFHEDQEDDNLFDAIRKAVTPD